jgi:glucan phosphoethanolaminetransferase (alkaline phosphatase superfamily)
MSCCVRFESQTKDSLKVCCAFLISVFLIICQCVKHQGDITPFFYIEQNLLGRPPYNFWYQTFNALHLLEQKAQIENAKKMSFCANRKEQSIKEVYVLAIGESLRYSNLSLSGYNRNTTPNLDSLENIMLYTNYYSTATLTMYSVPLIYTRATPNNLGLAYRERGLHVPFKETGFKTYVVCCNNLLNYEHYLSDGVDSLISVKSDIEIPPIIDSLTSTNEKLFITIQFWGNHGLYTNFSPDFNVYRPNPIGDDVSWENKEGKVNAYDNTVLQQDYVMTKIIKAIDKPFTSSSFLFVSDHGEDLRPGSGGHGGSCRPDKAEYHVPLIIWNSKTWIDNNPSKYKALRRNRNVPCNADNIFYSICDMADINLHERYTKKEWSLLSDLFEPHDRLLLLPDGRTYIHLN